MANNSRTSRLKLPMSLMLQPDYVGHPELTGPSLSFLIDHPSGKKIIFDLGVRYDWQRLPSFPKFRENAWGIMVQKDTARILQENKIDVANGAISSIVLSHHHWDHVGDPSTFPSSTELVVGPGFMETHLPGYPANPKATLLQTDHEGREIREPAFSDAFKIGRFQAHDFFGDGSFYLLSTPGHSVGHLCALARTTASPPTFIFLAGDASHHAAEFRPTEYLPLPALVPANGTGEDFRSVHAEQSAVKPFYNVTAGFAHSKELADWTIAGLGEFDCQENVLLLTAHDEHILDEQAGMEFFPAPLNDWLEKGLAERVKWLFLRDFEGALRRREEGGEAFTWGVYP